MSINKINPPTITTFSFPKSRPKLLPYIISLLFLSKLKIRFQNKNKIANSLLGYTIYISDLTYKYTILRNHY